MAPPTGAQCIAKTLHDLGVRVLFGLVGVPVTEIAEEAIAIGIRFVGLRNEQSASYAATAYGYLTGKPGVCLVVAGPGVLHAMAGVGNASANSFPLLLLAGSSETHLVTKGNFQEMDAVSLLSPHVKIAIRPTLDMIPQAISNAYRASWYGRPGTGFVDLPGDLIKGEVELSSTKALPAPPTAACPPERIAIISKLIKSAKAPLVIVGKGAAYSQAEAIIRQLINSTNIPFLPTPMGKGIIPDSHPSNTSSARSVALKNADVVLILGARLNWILHFGEDPKWNPDVKIIQVDISPDELGKNAADPSLAVLGDIGVVVSQLVTALKGWSYDTSSAYTAALAASTYKNEAKAAQAAKINTIPMTYHRVFDVIKNTLHELSPPEDGGIVYVSEGSNTMDISRSVFPVEHPRLRLDAGSYATMGVGLGYAVAAHAAYNWNLPTPEASSGPSASRKKIVCLEGDSAFGFSMAEVETMSRYGMDVLIFVINNSGIYNGDTALKEDWKTLQKRTVDGEKGGLRSWSLTHEVQYEMVAEMCGGKGYLVRTPEELRKATEEGYKAKGPVVINVIIQPGRSGELVVSCPFPDSVSISSLDNFITIVMVEVPCVVK